MNDTHSMNLELVDEAIQMKFKKDTDLFLQQIIKSHLNAHIDSYMERYYEKGRNIFKGWKNLLYGIIEEIQYQIEIDQELRYPENIIYRHKIKLINHSVNVKEHSINILMINLETESILKVTITLERNVKVIRPIISAKAGLILF
jgi:hypothetical protein